MIGIILPASREAVRCGRRKQMYTDGHASLQDCGLANYGVPNGQGIVGRLSAPSQLSSAPIAREGFIYCRTSASSSTPYSPDPTHSNLWPIVSPTNQRAKQSANRGF